MTLATLAELRAALDAVNAAPPGSDERVLLGIRAHSMAIPHLAELLALAKVAIKIRNVSESEDWLDAFSDAVVAILAELPKATRDADATPVVQRRETP